MKPSSTRMLILLPLALIPVLLVAMPGCGGGSNGTGAGGSGGGGAPGGAGLRATFDGTAINFGNLTAAATEVGGAVVRYNFEVKGFVTTPEYTTLLIRLHVEKGATTSTASCDNVSTGAANSFYMSSQRGAGAFTADSAGECSAEFTMVPAAGVGRLVGTFSGMLVGSPTPITATAGSVDVDIATLN